jgi:phosphoribosylglycinamide formyltransferase-1
VPSDTEGTLAQKVHAVEHEIYPKAIAWFASGRLSLEGNQVMLDDGLLSDRGVT